VWLNKYTIGINPALNQIEMEDDSGAGQVLKGGE
jgi:hypothetical protein